MLQKFKMRVLGHAFMPLNQRVVSANTGPGADFVHERHEDPAAEI
ncbi:hypothetical protein [Pseudomonas floridensis]|nr:hypothetical protein [Pseudomonas floridensis]